MGIDCPPDCEGECSICRLYPKTKHELEDEETRKRQKKQASWLGINRIPIKGTKITTSDALHKIKGTSGRGGKAYPLGALKKVADEIHDNP